MGRWEKRERSGWVKREGQGLSVVVGRKGGAGLGLKRNPNWLTGLDKRVRLGLVTSSIVMM